MMLAADRIAPIVLAASPELRDALYRKYFGVSEDWLRSHGAAEAEEAQILSTGLNRWRGV